jgi:hypothetical protein
LSISLVMSAPGTYVIDDFGALDLGIAARDGSRADGEGDAPDVGDDDEEIGAGTGPGSGAEGNAAAADGKLAFRPWQALSFLPGGARAVALADGIADRWFPPAWILLALVVGAVALVLLDRRLKRAQHPGNDRSHGVPRQWAGLGHARAASRSSGKDAG